ncbi:MAG: translation initiation factor IF-2 subunit gamma [Nanoarchaeota archaeon]|nr:translation initiation factor IF-2 subunit gamma [Nanoarchaeota archaeon]
MENLETINIIIAGHIDHGKTTLLQRLTGKWTDTHSEELKRGITIKLGYADTIIYHDAKEGYNREKKGTPKRYVSFVDAPGHEMLMATMLSGAAIVDAAILVIAANEGIKPQTKEHLMALQAKNIKDIIIVQNKIDLVTKEQAIKNYQETKNALKGTVGENAPIIPVSAQQGVNIEKIYEEICKIKTPPRHTEKIPIFLVARSFDINKPGTKPENLHGAVLGGTLKLGKLRVGDQIEIKPGLTIKEANQIIYKTIKTKIKSLHKGNYELKEITPGGSLSIETELDMSSGKADSLSGCVVSAPDKLPKIISEIKIKYTLFPEIIGSVSQTNTKVEPLKTTETMMLSVNTSVTVGTIKKLTNSVAELSLKIPIVPFKGENVGIARNINGHWRLIGFGKIV